MLNMAGHCAYLRTMSSIYQVPQKYSGVDDFEYFIFSREGVRQ